MLIYDIYRATPCVTRGFCCRPVSDCPSVCLSVTFVVRTAEDVKLLSRLGSSIILFFDRESISNSKKNPFIGALNTRGGEIPKFAIFDRNCRLSEKRYRIGPFGDVTMPGCSTLSVGIHTSYIVSKTVSC